MLLQLIHFTRESNSPTSALNLDIGDYSISITDANDCPFDTTIQLSQPDELILSFESTVEPSCFGIQDGSISVSHTGGQGDLTYQWTKDSFPIFVDTDSLTNLGNGSYAVFAVDDSSCASQSIVFDLNQPSAVVLSLDSLGDPLCNGGSDGYIHVDVAGGVAPYVFNWTGTSDSDKQYNGLNSGNYQVVVSDSFDCKDTLTFSLTEPQSIAFNSITTDVNCFGQSTGTIIADVFGGVGSYVSTTATVGTVTSSSSENITLQNLPFGQYTISAVDSNLCSYSENFDISQNTEIQASFSDIVSETCDDDNAQATINASGGTPPIYLRMGAFCSNYSNSCWYFWW